MHMNFVALNINVIVKNSFYVPVFVSIDIFVTIGKCRIFILEESSGFDYYLIAKFRNPEILTYL